MKAGIQEYHGLPYMGRCIVFVDLAKPYDRVPRERLWYSTRKSRVTEQYVRMVQDMHESCKTMLRLAVVVTEQFKEEVGLY